MLSRRDFLLSAGATLALAGCATAPESGVQGPSPSDQLSALLEAFFQEALDDSPEFVTALGLDKGDRAGAKARLDDRSLADLDADRARTADQLRRLQGVDRTTLAGMAAVNFDSVMHVLALREEGNRRFAYGQQGAGRPYVLSQLTGAYQDIPDFLGSRHRIETMEDAEGYLSRLEAFGTAIDQDTERAGHDMGLGVVPPDFVVERALAQMAGLKVAPDQSTLVNSLVDRAREKGLAGDWAGRATRAYLEKVVPALDRQMALMGEMKGKAVHDAGVWRLPDGEAYYELALRVGTTTRLTAEEVHQIGLDQAAELSARAETLLRAQGLTQGTVGQRIRSLYDDPKLRYPNTDAGKETLIGELNQLVKATQGRLPDYFRTLPKAPVEIKRVPKFIEAGAPGGYYNQPTLDGSRPGIYWINLRDTAEWPRWSLPTLTYHEAIPGHHLQLSLQQAADLPMLRRTGFLSAYGEGWALYAEELAREMGVYADDPLAEIGYIQSSLFRSARLVVDTGLHAKRWSREKAIEVMTSIDGSLPSAATTEIERYCVWPGQATSYMVGKLTWLRLRAKARAALGNRFDIKAFHDAGLLSGSMPLTVLEGVIDQYVASVGG